MPLDVDGHLIRCYGAVNLDHSQSPFLRLVAYVRGQAQVTVDKPFACLLRIACHCGRPETMNLLSSEPNRPTERGAGY